MKYKFSLVLLLLSLMSCHRVGRVQQAEEQIITIDSSFDAVCDTTMQHYLIGVNSAVEEQLKEVLGICPQDLNVERPECGMLNWASDALLSVARQHFPGRVDVAVVNIGGMRCEWPKGEITKKHVFCLMPFDNKMVVLTLTGQDLLDLAKVMILVGGEGVAGMRVMGENGKLIRATIDGRPIIAQELYYVATSDYLSQGMDQLVPLSRYSALWDSGLTIRDLYIDFIRRQGIVEARVDGRMEIK